MPAQAAGCVISLRKKKQVGIAIFFKFYPAFPAAVFAQLTVLVSGLLGTQVLPGVERKGSRATRLCRSNKLLPVLLACVGERGVRWSTKKKWGPESYMCTPPASSVPPLVSGEALAATVLVPNRDLSRLAVL